ncbi:MAG: YidC/Oxa1 family membrane protein insertase [Nitrospirae bacterium]|nr:YidC/Oxa1 family membrane protein insertase [Fimbriimonadaceae bacterium]
MSKPAAKPGNFIQTLLLATMIFLGLQLFMNSQNQGPDLSATEILGKMEEAAANLQDQSIARMLPQYESKIGREEMTEEQRQERRLRAKLLTAVTQYRAGIQRNDTGRLDAAYNTLVHDYLSLEGKPIWTQEFGIPEPVVAKSREQFPDTRYSGKAFYEKLTGELQQRNSTTFKYAIMDFLVGLTGKVPSISYCVAALLLAIIVRAIVWPLSQRQLMWSRQMSQLQPLVAEIKEKYQSDPQEFQKRTMALYQEYGINPMAGCFPALLQMPLFLFVYNWMTTYRFEFQKGVFLWVNPDTAQKAPWLVAPNLGHQDKILLVVYTALMVLNSFLTPVSDPSNAKQQRLMGVGISLVFSISLFFWPLPSAFVLYWIFTLVFASIQSIRAYRLPVPPLVKKASAAGGVIPTKPVSKAPSGNGAASNPVAEARKRAALTHKQKKKR